MHGTATAKLRDVRAANNDPTQTYYLRARFRAAADKRWQMLARTLRQAMVEHDLVGLHGISRLPHGDKVEGFAAWLAEELRQKVLGFDGRWLRQYVHAAAGIAERRAIGLNGTQADRNGEMETLAVSELQGIIAAAQQQLTRVLAHAMMANFTPTKTANALSAVIRTMRKRTAAMTDYVVAKTHAVTTLSSFRNAGVRRVGIIPERVRQRIVGDRAPDKPSGPSARTVRRIRARTRRLEALGEVDVITAEDDRVCDECDEIAAGGPYDIDEALSLIPAHPKCRCAFVPTSDERFARDYSPDQPREPAGSSEGGRFTVGSGGHAASGGLTEAFVSPNIHELDFKQAQSGLRSSRQRELLRAASYINDKLGLTAENHSVIGAWADGAENSTMAVMTGVPLEKAKVASAMEGWLADQKSVLVFEPRPDGDSFMASFPATGKLDDIHANLLSDGVAFHTIEPTTGGATVHVFGNDQKTLDAVAKAAERYGQKYEIQFGRGEFVGTTKTDGTDREQRDDAKRVYEAVISKAAAAQQFEGRDVGEIWDDVRDNWPSLQVAPGESGGSEILPTPSSGQQFAVHVNPSERDLRALAKEHGSVRVILTRNHDLYAWNASNAIHAYVQGELDLDAKDWGELAVEKGKLIDVNYGGADDDEAVARAQEFTSKARLGRPRHVRDALVWLDYEGQPRSAPGEISPHGGEFASAGGWSGEPLKGSQGDPALVSTALTTAVGRPGSAEREQIKSESFDYQRVDLDQLRKDPQRFANAVNSFRNADLYPYMRASDFNGNVEHDARAVVDRIKSNLRVLWNDISQETKDLWRNWYVGAHNLIGERMKQYPGVSRAAMTAMYAAQSPGTQWDINVHLGDRLLDTVFHHGDDKWDKEMADAAQRHIEKAEAGLEKAKDKELVQKNIDDMKATFREVKRAGSYNNQSDDYHRAAWIKLWNDAHDESPVLNVNIDGSMGAPMKIKQVDDNGEPADMSGKFGVIGRIENAVKALRSGGNAKVISDSLGELHKVRSFYNNILDPHSANDDVTIDTHAAGAAWLDPVGQKSKVMGQMFGSAPPKGVSSSRLGVYGTYPFYADAYREFAKEKDVGLDRGRELQSIIWEHKIALFRGAPDAKKQLIKEAWQRFHDNPAVTLEQTQQRILRIAKAGYNQKARAKRMRDGDEFDYSADEAGWDSADG